MIVVFAFFITRLAVVRVTVTVTIAAVFAAALVAPRDVAVFLVHFFIVVGIGVARQSARHCADNRALSVVTQQAAYDRACRRAGKGGFLLVCRTPRFRPEAGMRFRGGVFSDGL